MRLGFRCSEVAELVLFALVWGWLLEDFPYVTSLLPCGRLVCIMDQGPRTQDEEQLRKRTRVGVMEEDGDGDKDGWVGLVIDA